MCSSGVPGAAEAGWNAQPQDTAALAVASACGVTLLLLGNVLLLSLPTPSHSPPGCQQGGCFAWGLPWLQALSWRTALFPQSPNAVSVWTHVFLLAWHCCRPRMLGISLSLVPREKHFHQLWWCSGGPFLNPPVGSCSGAATSTHQFAHRCFGAKIMFHTAGGGQEVSDTQ